jgi:ribosomal protein L9
VLSLIFNHTRLNVVIHLGAIVPLPRGLMRNYWYPRGKAEYVTRSQLKELGLKDSTIERDVMFMATKLPDESRKVDPGNFGLKLTPLAVGF